MSFPDRRRIVENNEGCAGSGESDGSVQPKGGSGKVVVRARGLEPPSLSGPGPKPGASATFATPA